MKQQTGFALVSSIVLLSFPLSSPAQEAWLLVVEDSRAINSIGMKILLGWALLNISGGAIAYFRTASKTMYFHQMNAIWNLFNGGIAIGALSSMGDASLGSLQEAYRSGMSMEKILLANAGLDVAYITAGGFLLERGKRKTSDRLRGYGPSLMLQGGFLLLLDVVLFSLNMQQNHELYELFGNADAYAIALTF